VEAEQTARAVMLQEQKPTHDVNRQPEATQDEDEKKKLHPQRDSSQLARQSDKPEEEQ
jgi:hypothetical protein